MRENVHEDVESGRGDGKRLPNMDCVEAVHQLYAAEFSPVPTATGGPGG